MNAPPVSIRILIPPAVLAVVATCHIAQWYTVDRSSWGTGAGFGMFATVDYHGSRFVRCYATIDQEVYVIEPPERFDELVLRARVIPTQERLQLLARELLACRWSTVALANAGSTDPANVRNGIVESSAAPPEAVAVQIDNVRVELWGMRLSAPRRQLGSYIINQVSISQSAEEAWVSPVHWSPTERLLQGGTHAAVH